LTTEIIKGIKEAERAVEEKIKSAHQEAKDLLLRAEEEAERIIKAAEDSEILKGKKALEAADKEAQQEAGDKKKQNDMKCQAMKQKAEEKMEEAVNLVLERIVKINGNS